MITHLRLNQLVLVDQCALALSPGFIAVTGETGAGKTVLIKAIHLVLGARADMLLIRKDSEKARVEAAFDITCNTEAQFLLNASGIPFIPTEDLIIQRELTREGKNRAFINGELVTLPFLQKLGQTLVEVVGQHAYHSLMALDAQRILLDQLGRLTPQLSAFQTAWSEEKALKEQRSEQQKKIAQSQEEEKNLIQQMEEIGALRLKEGEEELLIQEHRSLAHAQEILEKLSPIAPGIGSFLPLLNRFHKICDSLLTYNAAFQSPSSLLQEASITLTEALRELQTRMTTLESNPQRLLFLEERLAAIHILKRKYQAASDGELIEKHQKARRMVETLSQIAPDLEALDEAIHSSEKKTTACAHDLTEKRKVAAERLSLQIAEQLQALNMPGAEVRILVHPTSRSSTGEDLVEFWMRANIGEPLTPIKDCASGGELCRFLFALKILSEGTSRTLIFDEIDANIGGATARILGKKLHELGKQNQVLCITHFPQVAEEAHHHLLVEKKEEAGRTFTEIRCIEALEKEKELLRMFGKKEYIEGISSS